MKSWWNLPYQPGRDSAIGAPRSVDALPRDEPRHRPVDPSQSDRDRLLRAALLQRTQIILYGVLGNFAAHVGSYLGRKAVVDSRPDPGVRRFVDIVLQTGPAVRDARRCRSA